MTCDCSVPDLGSLGQLWRCATCGTWWVAFERYGEEGMDVWWEPIITDTERGPWVSSKGELPGASATHRGTSPE